MTFELINLNLTTPFLGNGTITTASDACLGISHIGSSKLLVLRYAFELKKVLHVPKLSQHLLYIYRLCKDNKCRFVCDDIWFWIQDKITRRILLKGLCRAGLYPIPFHNPQKLIPTSFASHACYIAKPVNTSLWNKRLRYIKCNYLCNSSSNLGFNITRYLSNYMYIIFRKEIYKIASLILQKNLYIL